MLQATRLLLAAVLLACVPFLGPMQALAQEQDNVWRVGKISGEAWIAGAAVQQASLGSSATLRPGETIRTGRTGRVLLVRGAESMLVSPNSQVVLPTASGAGRATTILQQAGSILLDVEKRNVQHFEVETPFLAAVVKGTQFRVTVTPGGARVDVQRGQVEVADFRSGQYALVQPGQAASVAGIGAAGLKLSGSGRFDAVRQGTPRASSVRPVAIPRGGFSEASAAGQRRIGRDESGARAVSASGGSVRIGATLGEVNLNVHAATKGLARDGGAGRVAASGRSQATVWSSGELAPAGSGMRNGRSTGNPESGSTDTARAQANANSQANGHANRPDAAGNGRNGGSVRLVGNSGGNGRGSAGGGGNGNGNGGGNSNGGGNGNGNGNGGNNSGGNGHGSGNAGGGQGNGRR